MNFDDEIQIDQKEVNKGRTIINKAYKIDESMDRMLHPFERNFFTMVRNLYFLFIFLLVWLLSGNTWIGLAVSLGMYFAIFFIKKIRRDIKLKKGNEILKRLEDKYKVLRDEYLEKEYDRLRLKRESNGNKYIRIDNVFDVLIHEDVVHCCAVLEEGYGQIVVKSRGFGEGTMIESAGDYVQEIKLSSRDFQNKFFVAASHQVAAYTYFSPAMLIKYINHEQWVRRLRYGKITLMDRQVTFDFDLKCNIQYVLDFMRCDIRSYFNNVDSYIASVKECLGDVRNYKFIFTEE